MGNSSQPGTAFGVKRVSLRNTLAAAILLLFIRFATPASADEFFDGPTASPGNPMFFGIYSILKEQKGNLNLQKISDGGFTTAGPHYNAANGGDPINNPTMFYSRVADTAEEELGIIAHITWHPNVINDTSGNIRPNSMAALPPENLRAHVRQVMDFTLNDAQANSTTDKWYITPEELRPWMNAEMNYLRIVAEEVKNYDPLGRPVSMYNPNNRDASQLETIIGQGLDEALMGVYVTEIPFNSRGARLGLGLDRIMASVANTATTPILGAQLSSDFPTAEIDALRTALGGVSEAEAIKHVIRHDVYQGLLRGIEGVQIWSGHDNRPGLTTFSEQLDGYISVSEDLNLGLNLSDVFLRGERRTDFQASVVTGPSTVSFVGSPADYSVNTITTADIAYGHHRYLFLANSSNSSLAIRVDGLPLGIPLSQFDDLFDNAAELSVDISTGEMLLNMEPLEVIAFAIEAVAGTPGDYNGDGFVDAADYTVWRDNLGGDGSALLNRGVGQSGAVDAADYSIWKSKFGQPSGASVLAQGDAVVPEPSCWLTVIGSAGLLLFCRRVRLC